MNIRDYFEGMGYSHQAIEKQLKKIKQCKHRRTESLKEYRTNYPFGRKSKAHKTFKRIWAKRCENCGSIFKPGDTRFHKEDQ